MANEKNKVLSDLFGPVHKGPRCLRFWSSSGCPVSGDDINVLLSFDVEKPQQPDGCINVVKSDNRTRVLRFQSNSIPLITKIFRMHRFKDSIGHKRFAFSELQNNTLARQRGIHTPMCCAYFEQLLFGLVWQSGVVMEDLVDHTELANLMSSGKRTMFDAIPIFKELYCRGVNHIDMSPKNIFVRERDNHFVVIDWQYCSFYPSANDLQLCLMAAVFLLYNNMNYEDSMWHLWLKALFDQCHPEISYDKMLQAVRIMRNRRLRRPARLNLDVSGLGLKEIW